MGSARRWKRATEGATVGSGGDALGATAKAADGSWLGATGTDAALDACARCSGACSLQATSAKTPASKNPNLTSAAYRYAPSLSRAKGARFRSEERRSPPTCPPEKKRAVAPALLADRRRVD